VTVPKLIILPSHRLVLIYSFSSNPSHGHKPALINPFPSTNNAMGKDFSCTQEECAQIGTLPGFGFSIKGAKIVGDNLLLKTDLRHSGLRMMADVYGEDRVTDRVGDLVLRAKYIAVSFRFRRVGRRWGSCAKYVPKYASKYVFNFGGIQKLHTQTTTIVISL
jgi:hypothetical protein